MLIILKGSSSSGWYAPPRGTHTGELHNQVGSGRSDPNRIGGDNWHLRTKDPFGSREYIPSTSDLELVRSTMSDIHKIVNVGDVAILIGTASPNLGHRTKARDGERVHIVNPIALRKAMSRTDISDKQWVSWFGGSRREYSEMFRHTLAHEVGHGWWYSAPASLRDNWTQFYKSNVSKMSGYARYYVDPHEGFADSFARFATGEDMDWTVEEFFMENVKEV